MHTKLYFILSYIFFQTPKKDQCQFSYASIASNSTSTIHILWKIYQKSISLYYCFYHGIAFAQWAPQAIPQSHSELSRWTRVDVWMLLSRGMPWGIKPACLSIGLDWSWSLRATFTVQMLSFQWHFKQSLSIYSHSRFMSFDKKYH